MPINVFKLAEIRKKAEIFSWYTVHSTHYALTKTQCIVFAIDNVNLIAYIFMFTLKIRLVLFTLYFNILPILIGYFVLFFVVFQVCNSGLRSVVIKYILKDSP